MSKENVKETPNLEVDKTNHETVYLLYCTECKIACVIAVKKTKQIFGTIRNSPGIKYEVANTFSNLHQNYFR